MLESFEAILAKSKFSLSKRNITKVSYDTIFLTNYIDSFVKYSVSLNIHRDAFGPFFKRAVNVLVCRRIMCFYLFWRYQRYEEFLMQLYGIRKLLLMFTAINKLSRPSDMKRQNGIL